MPVMILSFAQAIQHKTRQKHKRTQDKRKYKTNVNAKLL